MVMKLSLFRSSLTYTLTLVIGSVFSAHAAPGTIAQQPLFLQSSVAANIFFLNDNSSSMQWELMTKDYSEGGGLKEGSDGLTPALINNPDCAKATLYEFILETSNRNGCDTAAEEEWRARFHGYNSLYYNPNRIYKPWAGNDSDGQPFKPAKIKKAKINPNDPDSEELDLTKDSAVLVKDGTNATRSYYSETTWTTWCTSQGISDCHGWRYYSWNDANDDGVIDNGELVLHWVKDLDNGAGNNPPVNNQKNFANWFSYHRSREFAAKYALSVAIQEATQARIGYGTLNDNSDNGIRINEQSANHKTAVLNKLFNTRSSGSTPLRSRLKAVGDYYETGSFFGSNGNSPILAEADGGVCQSNNVIMMTDGFYTGETLSLGNVDGNNGAPYADTFLNTLADVAMYYYERDLATNIPDLASNKHINEKDYTPNVDDTALHQHMNTHTLAFGLAGTITEPNQATINAAEFNWPEPQAGTPTLIDDLFHAAVNGRGNYLSAADPDALVEALLSTVRDISDNTQSATSVAMSAFRLEENSLIFFSRFNSDTWSGELVAHSINADGLISAAETWNAATKLDNNTNRNIFTYSNNNGVAFQWGNNLSTTMQAELIAGDTRHGIGKARLDYLRGATANDFNFRQRDSSLGDIINSSPVYVGAPASPYPDSNPFGTSSKRYFDFWNDKKGRTKMLYVGANDGMLHGFNANTGEELMAYVPATIFPNLHELTDQDYTHRYYVDKTPTVSDAFFANNWHTVLVGALGGGGQGLFALDITDPDNFDANNVLWEFNSSNDADMGYSFSQPMVALTETGRWAVIVGNGYNSANGIATLFIIYLDADLSNGWDEGSDYRKISTAVGDATDKNGLSTPTAVDSNGDGYVDRVYAGDLQGNMWAFSLTGGASNWGVTYKNGSTPLPLFQAKNAAGDLQPITAKPSVIRHPAYPNLSNAAPNLMVLFGTGQYVSVDDLSNSQTQSFYGIWDKGQATDQTNKQLSRGNLVEQTITTGTVNGQDVRITSNAYVPYGETDNTKRFGWYIDLHTADAKTGERIVSNAVVINDVAFFTTYIPNSEVCGTGGSSWFMFLNAANGSYPDEPVISINYDRYVDDKDLVTLNQGDPTAPSGLLIEGTLGSPSLDMGNAAGNGTVLLNTGNGIENYATDVGGYTRGKRISWRELRPQ